MHKAFQEIFDSVADYDKTPQSVGMELRVSLSSIIHRHLFERKWTQKQLAKASGVAEQMLTRIMHSNTNCTFETAGKVLFALGLRGGLIEEIGPSLPTSDEEYDEEKTREAFTADTHAVFIERYESRPASDRFETPAVAARNVFYQSPQGFQSDDARDMG